MTETKSNKSVWDITKTVFSQSWGGFIIGMAILFFADNKAEAFHDGIPNQLLIITGLISTLSVVYLASSLSYLSIGSRLLFIAPLLAVTSHLLKFTCEKLLVALCAITGLIIGLGVMLQFDSGFFSGIFPSLKIILYMLYPLVLNIILIKTIEQIDGLKGQATTKNSRIALLFVLSLSYIVYHFNLWSIFTALISQ